MEKFIFVILHYINIQDTIECIESIEKINYNNYDIVIVDNCSPNHTGQKLGELYHENDNIHIIISEINLGFAKGINIGFTYAKTILKADYICEINNDTIIKEKDFIGKCIEVFKKEKYYIIGPDVISLIDSGHQNPLTDYIFTLKQVFKNIIYLLIKLLSYYLKLEKLVIILLEKRKRYYNTGIISYNKLKKNLILSGCCLIFSPLYVQRFNGLYSKTFMYGEESILFYICKKLDLKYLYINEIKIFHKEGASTKIIYKGRKKEIFFYKNLLKSKYLLFKLMIGKRKFMDDILG